MFLSFVGSNVDEFFMVRVAGLKRQIEKGVSDSGPDAMSPAEQLRAIRASVIRLNRAAQECWCEGTGPGAGAGGNSHPGLSWPHRRATHPRRLLFSGHHLPHADSVGLRSRATISRTSRTSA